jgi:excinuclease UvrABC nuclease subunit
MTLPRSSAPSGESLPVHQTPSRLPSIDGCARFGAAWSLAVPLAGGVYFIHDLRGVLYVGRTGSLRKRFSEHLVNSHNPSLRRALVCPIGQLYFSWIRCVSVDGQSQMERSLIKLLRPTCNVMMNDLATVLH